MHIFIKIYVNNNNNNVFKEFLHNTYIIENDTRNSLVVRSYSFMGKAMSSKSMDFLLLIFSSIFSDRRMT